jgi:hypothetical protein
MSETPLFPVAAPPAVTVPLHSTGERLSIQLFTVEGTSLGPYVGLPLSSGWTPFSGHLFTRATAEKIVNDLHTEDADCGLTAAFAEDGTLTFTWTEDYDCEGGQKVVKPDPWGRYEIGDLWPWDMWEDVTGESDEQHLYALGAAEYRRMDRSPLLSRYEAAIYGSGRLEAHALTLHLEDTPDHALNAALRPYGITGEEYDDMGNSWLVFPYGLDADEFDGSGPHVVAYVSVEGEEEVFVDEMVGIRRGHWHVRTAADGSRRETEVLTVSADETERVAAFIADLMVVP